MTGPLPSRGRRDNGLPATEWGALVDLDPRLSEPLLESLAAEGVAAYVEPASDLDSYTRASTLPDRPLDRLWVDPARADVARGIVAHEVADLTALLAEVEPGATVEGLVRPVPRTAAVRVLAPPEIPHAPTDDELFAQIIAGFDTETADPVGRWSVTEDLDPETEAPRRRKSDAPTPLDDGELPSWVEPDALPDEGHFEPPPPPRIPRPRLRTLLATGLLLLGLAMMFAPFQIGLDDSPIYLITGMLLTGGGASLLVAGMRDAPWGNDPDDGAVV
jgi:hypothetical protein